MNKFFSAIVVLSSLAIVGFTSLSNVSLASAKSQTNIDEFAVIGEDMPRSIDFEGSLKDPSATKVETIKVAKKNVPAVIETGWKRCYVQVLEQQGSPIARTVKVCE